MAGDARPEDFWEKVQDLHQKNAELKAPLEQHAPPRCQCPLGYHLEGCPEQSKEPEEEPLCGCVTTGYHREGCPQRPEVGVPTAENQLWGRPAAGVAPVSTSVFAPPSPETLEWLNRQTYTIQLPEGACRQCAFPLEKGVHTCSVPKPQYVKTTAQEILATQPVAAVRTFATGANRDLDDTKIDYDGFLHPLTVKRFGEYMTKHRHLKDGTVRSSSNWWAGMPREVYTKSLSRHVEDVRLHIHGYPEAAVEPLEEALCAVIFNAQGLLLEVLKGRDV